MQGTLPEEVGHICGGLLPTICHGTLRRKWTGNPANFVVFPAWLGLLGAGQVVQGPIEGPRVE